MKNTLYNKLKALGVLTLMLFSTGMLITSCVEEDDGSDIQPTLLPPVLGLVSSSFVEEIQEGETATILIGAFTGVDSDVDINATWSMTGAINMTGTATIPAGELTVGVPITLPDDLIAQEDRTVTFTVTGGDLPVNDLEINDRIPITTSVTIVDNAINFGVYSIDEIVLETDGMLQIPLDFGGVEDSIDEVLTITFEIDASSTAVEGVDFTIAESTTFMYDPAVDTVEDFPSINITLIDDILANDTLDLVINILDITGSGEVVFIDTAASTATYQIVNDYKLFSLSADTIYVDSAAFAGGFEVDILLGGPGSIAQQASIEFNEEAALTGILEPNVSNTFIFNPGIESQTYSASLDPAAFTFDPMGGDTTFFQINLENVGSLNNDEEIMINDMSDTFILGLIDPE